MRDYERVAALSRNRLNPIIDVLQDVSGFTNTFFQV